MHGDVRIALDRGSPYLGSQSVDEVEPAFEDPGEVSSVEQHEPVFLSLPVPIDCCGPEACHRDEQTACGVDAAFDLVGECCEVCGDCDFFAPAGFDEVSEGVEDDRSIDLVGLSLIGAVVVELGPSEQSGE